MPKSSKSSHPLAVADRTGSISPDDKIRQLFASLKAQWEKDMEGVSNFARIISHPAYLRIIGQGSPILPAILEDMDAGGGPWFVALTAITGANPVKPRHRMNVSLMRRDWMQWGRAHGYA